MLRSAWNIAQVRRYSRKLINNSQLIGEHPSGLQLYRATCEHIPILLPITRDWIRNEPFCKGLGVQPNDGWIWPLLFNCTRYPFSFFAWNSKNNSVVGFALQELLLRDHTKYSIPRARKPPLEDEDLFHTIGRLLMYTERMVLDQYPYEDAFVCGQSLYLRPQHGDLAVAEWFLQSVLTATQKWSKEHGCKKVVACITSESMLAFALETGFEVVDSVPKFLFTRPDGSTFCTAEGSRTAKLVQFRLKSVKNFRPPFPGLYQQHY